MSILVNVGAGAKAVAPQISAETLEKPGAFEAAYKQWRQYELNKGSDACSFQQCFAENLLRVLVKRKGVKFGAAEQASSSILKKASARGSGTSDRCGTYDRIAKTMFMHLAYSR